MNILKDRRVAEYISSLNGLSSNQYIMFTFCECINNNNTPEDAHSNIAEPCSSNLAELAADRKNVSLIQMYITITSYFKADTMKFLVNKMLECKDVETVEHYYNVLDKNLKLHPPCAQYMDEEYEQLLLSSYRKYFGEMTLWDYIIECLKNITRGSLLYGDDDAFDLAFKRCFCFCICILQVDFEVSKNKNKRSLAAKCLNYKLERETRMNEISTLLDKSYNTGYNFKMSVIHLAILVSQLQCN